MIGFLFYSEVAAAGLLLATTAYTILFFMPGVSVNVFIFSVSVATLGYISYSMMIWAFISDIIDYHEDKTGLREDATIFAILAFCRTMGSTLSGMFGGLILAWVGYKAGAAQQSQATLDSIYTAATIGPAVFYFLQMLSIMLYPLNKKRLMQMANDLSKKRSAQA